MANMAESTQMTTGILIAVIIGLLTAAALFWFITRAERSQKNEPGEAGQRPGSPDQSSASQGASQTVGGSLATDRTSQTEVTNAPSGNTTARATAAAAAAVTGVGAGAAGAAALAAGSAKPESANHNQASSVGSAAGAASSVHGAGAAQATLASAEVALAGDYTVSSGDSALDVREMLKILNLRESDAKRIDLSADDYRGLKAGTSALPQETVSAVADKLRAMIR